MITLLQFRTDQSGWHELKCIYDGIEIPYSEYLVLNVANRNLSGESIIELLKQSKGVILGGNGEGGFEDQNNPKKKDQLLYIQNKMRPILAALDEAGTPVFGTCFGHQLIADYIGGRVEPDADQAETGIVSVSLSPAGMSDPLFASFPTSFDAVVGHKSSVCFLPEAHTTLLASTSKCRVHSFRYKNMVGTQFHPELNRQDLQDRLEMYPEYAKNGMDTQDTTSELIVKKMLKNFYHTL